jgi:CRP/FNR family transcriptional regulator
VINITFFCTFTKNEAMEKVHCNICQFKAGPVKHLTDEELELLNKNKVDVHFKTGEIIIKQDALSTNVVYLQSGLVKIHVNSGHEERIIRVIGGPGYLCLPSNFCDRVHHFSATALEPSTVCFLDLTTFQKFIYSNGAFATQIIVDLSRNELRNMQSCINNTQRQTMGKIARCLLSFSTEIYKSKTFILPLTRQELSEISSTTRESVSRILSDLHSEKIIELDGKKVTILNEKLLEQISLKG